MSTEFSKIKRFISNKSWNKGEFKKEMDNPGISLFQGTDIQINNSKNIEEEEDLEDQLRRKEEVLALF